MKNLVVFLMLMFASFAVAGPTCSMRGTKVFYTNGVTTPIDKAQSALDLIETFNLNSLIDNNALSVKYKLAYNFTESVAKDFIEAAVQRFPPRFLREYGLNDRYAAYQLYRNGKMTAPAYSNELNSISETILNILDVWIREHANQSQYLKTVLEIQSHYEDALNRGERVFAISHSQGGLFMRDAYELMEFQDKEKYFSAFQVATPINGSFGKHFGHATHEKDRLISSLRFLFGSLESNITLVNWVVKNEYTNLSDYIIDFVLNHGMATTYLYDEGIKKQVINKMIETAQKLESNCGSQFRAIISYHPRNLAVSFDATDPEDPDVTGLTYEWDFGNGDKLVTDQKKIEYQYSDEGYYEVSLTVSNAAGDKQRESVEFNLQFGEYSFFIPIEPRGTYLFTDCSDQNPYGADCALPASKIDLTALYNNPDVNLREGDIISILIVGDRPWFPGVLGGGYNDIVMAVFEGDSGFLSPGPNSVAREAVSQPTLGRNLLTDIPEDRFVNFDTVYDVTPTIFQIPYGAKRLNFSLNDSYFKDNIDPQGNSLKAWVKMKIVRSSQSQLD